MHKYYIYIVKCSTGFQPVFQSVGLRLTNEDKSLIETDERLDAESFAPRSTFYSVQVTENLKLYSLTNTKNEDSFGRSGYDAICLISSDKNSHAKNFIDILNRVSEKYSTYKESNRLGQQEYEDILNDVVTIQDQQTFQYVQDTKKYYIKIEKGDYKSIENCFFSKNIYIANKIYAFENTQNLRTEQEGESLGLFQLKTNIFDKYSIQFDNGYLNKLVFKDKEITDFSNKNSLVILAPKGIKPLAYIGSKNEEKEVFDGVYFSRPNKQRPPNKGGEIISEPKKTNPATIIVVLFALVIIFFGTTFYLKEWPFNENGGTNLTEEDINIDENDVQTKDEMKMSFIQDTTTKNGNIYFYTDSITILKGWYFSEQNNQWICYRTKSDFLKNEGRKKLDSKNVNAFLKDNNITEANWNLFAEKLFEIKKKSIPKKKMESEDKNTGGKGKTNGTNTGGKGKTNVTNPAVKTEETGSDGAI
jgi:hypothetical protein